jgi:hypothetical protein
MHEHRRLALAHGQLGAILDLVALALEAPDHRCRGCRRPVDDVDELAGQEIEMPICQVSLFDQLSPAAISEASARTIGRASSAVMPGLSAGS